MLGILEALDEYSNAGALIGVDGLDDVELLGALRRMNPVKRQKTVNKLANTGASSRGSRAEFEKHFSQMPSHIKDGIANGTLRLADAIIYSIKPVNSKTIKLFETQDDKEVGLSSISNGKLPKNSAFLVSGIYLLAGVSTDATKDKVKATNYIGLETFPAIANGELELKANKKIILPETSTVLWKTASYHQVPIGYYKLANPRPIDDDVPIELTLTLGTIDGIPANTYVYAGLQGTISTP